MNTLIPLALQDTPALIESVFPAQKVSFEAQRERKAGSGQTLTALGSYWKGRKPLILVRAIVLGSLLPPSGDNQRDLEIFERLLAFDEESLARRALIQKTLKPSIIATRINLDNPWEAFAYTIRKPALTAAAVDAWRLPLDPDQAGAIRLRWRRDLSMTDKLRLYRKTLATFTDYEQQAGWCKRPEEVDQEWLYQPIWAAVNAHYAALGIAAQSHQELIEQLGILRYGHRPRVGDAFCGGGSIPFEAARLGCDVYASDLNPIACLLTWGALNIIGASDERRDEIQRAQHTVAAAVDTEITALGIEHDELGNRAKAYLYCLETRCPESGWLVPMAPSWVISKNRQVIAKLIPDRANQRFAIEVVSGASAAAMQAAGQGTVQAGALVVELDGKTYRTPIKTLRFDYRDAAGKARNRLRRWEQHDFKPRADDIFRERLYAIQWINAATLGSSRQQTFFAAVTEADLGRERKVETIVAENLARWQEQGLVPDMEIESGDKTNEPIRTRGWTHWHHLFNPRQLLQFAFWLKNSVGPENFIWLARALDFNSRLNPWAGQSGYENSNNLFSNQALNTIYNYCTRAWGVTDTQFWLSAGAGVRIFSDWVTKTCPSANVLSQCDYWITDPPYADAVHYHEITEFFIAWLRKNPPPPFDQWVWDSRRALAIKGVGDGFRRDMTTAYRALTKHMPDNGLQCVMFTHQDSNVWSDMIGIFWAAGLQVIAAWYIATETTSELKQGGYVQGTVILMLRKRADGERVGFKQQILPAVRVEVERQIRTMMRLNDEVRDQPSGPVFNDSDLQMAGYAAALKVLTAYTRIGDEDVTAFALRPRQRGEVTVVDMIVQQAAESANSLLVPAGISASTWQRLHGIQRFYLRMMEMETSGAAKLDNYQNFAKAFRVDDYTRVMASMIANNARLKRITELTSRELTANAELGATWLGHLIVALQQLLAEIEPAAAIQQLQAELPDFIEIRHLLIDILGCIETKAPEQTVRAAAEVLGDRLHNLRALSQ